MQITVNGKPEALDLPLPIAAYLQEKGYDTKLVVIEWNFATYPGDAWPDLMLEEGDNLEIIKIVGGG